MNAAAAANQSLATCLDLIDAVASADPDGDVIVLPEERESYSGFADGIREWARVFIALRVAPGAHVGVPLPNGTEFMRVLFGVMMAGAVPVPINTRSRGAEIASLAARADLVAIVTVGQSEHQPSLAAGRGPGGLCGAARRASCLRGGAHSVLPRKAREFQNATRCVFRDRVAHERDQDRQAGAAPGRYRGTGVTAMHELNEEAVLFRDSVRRWVGEQCPKDWCEPGGAWKEVVKTLNAERIVESATCLGIIDGVLEDALAYMMQRRAFGKLIGEFQALKHYVADIAMWQKQSELMLYHAAALQAAGQPCGMQAAMTKTIASDYACQAADLGISILGGMGYSAETDMQRYWRDARLLRIGPVSNEMARNMIAEGLGLPRSF